MATETARLEPSSDIRITAGSWVGAQAPSVVEHHRKETKPERPTPTPGASRPRPKATATSRQPEQPKVNFGGPTLKRNDVEEGSGCRNSSLLWKHAISYAVHWTTHHEVQDPSAGHKSDGWQMSYSSTPPIIVAPGARRLPTIIPITLYSTTCPADAPHCKRRGHATLVEVCYDSASAG